MSFKIKVSSSWKNLIGCGSEPGWILFRNLPERPIKVGTHIRTSQDGRFYINRHSLPLPSAKLLQNSLDCQKLSFAQNNPIQYRIQLLYKRRSEDQLPISRMPSDYTFAKPDVALDEGIYAFLEEFYRITDDPEGHDLYTQQYTPDGTAIMATFKCKGTEGSFSSMSRDSADGVESFPCRN